MKLSLMTTNTTEKEIFDGLYFVNESGEVITYNWRNAKTRSVLKPAKDTKGYLRVGLCVDKKLITKKVHRLVAYAFIPNPENKPCVNHINGIKTDNRVENLEWCTYKENTKHAIDNGLFSFQTPKKSVNKNLKRGEINGMSLLKSHEVIEIRKLYKPRIYTREMLSAKFNVTVSCIKDVLSRKSWSHI